MTEKTTIGEELYLIHLKRRSGNDDNDEISIEDPLPRKRSRSIGEELYEVHIKRSEGLAPDYDCGAESKNDTDFLAEDADHKGSYEHGPNVMKNRVNNDIVEHKKEKEK